ncbi:MAG: phospholipase D-like domain-containing protein [Ktedonobacteraceae bacterium]
MSVPGEQPAKNWWAEGDTPVRHDSRVNYFVDGRSVMLTMCLHFLKARTYIYLAHWGFTPMMEIVRGKDQRAGADGSPEQQALLAELRAAGLEEADIDFWCTHTLSLQAVLGHAVSKGVDVKVLLWDCLGLPGLSYYKPREAHEQLTRVGVTCLLDDSARGIVHHPVESLHQKIGIVDGTHAFVGGVDPVIELGGHFDHWDTSAHLFSSPLRSNSEDPHPYPWHDAHAHIEGPAAGDVEYNFRQRWNDLVQRHSWDNALLLTEHPPAPPLESKSVVQIARTIPEHTYNFQPLIVRGIAQLYAHALGNAQQFVYLENQYFWLHSYIGIDIPFLGADNPEMERNIRELGAALRRGAAVGIVLPDHPDPGRGYSEHTLNRLREEAPEAVKERRLVAFCLGTCASKEDGEHYRPIYVHAKVAIVDDVWSTVGSANLNNRGMRDDTEMNVAVLDRELAHSLRILLWSEHLGLLNDDDLLVLLRHLAHQQQGRPGNTQAEQLWHYLQETLADPLPGLRMMYDRAEDNLRRYKARQPLIGHLLPYLSAQDAAQQGLSFREAGGWIEQVQSNPKQSHT